MRKLFGWLCVFLVSGGFVEAAGLAVSPPSLSYDDPGVITLTISSLAPGETARVERYVDGNGNGVVDLGEPLVLSFLVTDGQVTMFGGERNVNIPGDEDGTANGQISVRLQQSALPEFNRVAVNYLFRIASPSANFAPVVQPFAVTPGSFAQWARGTATADGAPLAGAVVAFLSMADDGHFVGGALTDAAGGYALSVPPGDYLLAAVKSGFIMNLLEGPQASVQPGVDTTQNVAAAAADRTISGRVFDAVTSNGLPALQLFVGLGEDAFTVIQTDADGNFTAPVLAGAWEFELSEKSLALLGYAEGKILVDATAGNVSNVMVPLTYGRGQLDLVFFFAGGSFGNGTNGLISFPTHLNYYYALFGLEDVNFPTNVYFTGPNGSGLSSSPSAVFGGNIGSDSAWYSSPQVYLPPYPPGGVYTVNYKTQPIDFRLPDPDAQNRQVVLVPTVTVSTDDVLEHVRWSVRDVNGNPAVMPSSVTGIEIRVEGMTGGRLYEADVTPDATEHFVAGYVAWTNVSSIEMVYDDTAGNQYVIFWNRGAQPLEILSPTNLPPATVGVPYQHLFVASGGQTPYAWSLQPPGTLPSNLSFGGTGELSGTPLAAGTFDFTVRVTDANQQFIQKTVSLLIQSAMVSARLEPVTPITPGQFRVRVYGQSGRSYTLQYSTTLSGWADVVTTTAPSDVFDLTDSNATSTARFYRILTN